MAFDNHANLTLTTVATPPSPAGSGASLAVAAGTGANFPAAPFNCTVWPPNSNPTIANAEIVRVTAVNGDVLTILRSQETTFAQNIAAGWQIMNSETVKTFTDIEMAINNGLTYVSPPASASAAGSAGQFSYDGFWFYLYNSATSLWGRAALDTSNWS